MDGTLTVPAHDFSYARQMLNIAAHEDILSALAKRTNEEQKEAAAATKAIEQEEKNLEAEKVKEAKDLQEKAEEALAAEIKN